MARIAGHNHSEEEREPSTAAKVIKSLARSLGFFETDTRNTVQRHEEVPVQSEGPWLRIGIREAMTLARASRTSRRKF